MLWCENQLVETPQTHTCWGQTWHSLNMLDIIKLMNNIIIGQT